MIQIILKECTLNIYDYYFVVWSKSSLCTAVPLPSKKSGRERLCYGGGNRVPQRVVSPECVGNDLIGFHLNYFNLFCIIPKPCFDWPKSSRVLSISWSNSKSFQRASRHAMMSSSSIGHIRILGIGLELASN